MRSILVTGSDTGIGKTQAVAALARYLATGAAERPSGSDGGITSGAIRLQIVKVVETGRNDPSVEGDAARAQRLSAVPADAFTLFSFPEPISPAAAADRAGGAMSFEPILAAMGALPACDWRILEGAGGIGTPLDGSGRDWADLALAAGVDAIVVVVADRLGAVNQARLATSRASQTGIPCGVWLNALEPVSPLVASATRAGLASVGVPIWAEQPAGSTGMCRVGRGLRAIVEGIPALSGGRDPSPSRPETGPAAPESVEARCRESLREREDRGLRRALRVTPLRPAMLNLADNDYLDLARDPAIAAAVSAAAAVHGTSSSASPLITGWRAPHAELVERLASWHGIPHGMLWSSGFAANSAILGGLPARGDLVFADRLIHASMINGLVRSGARLQRYEHLDLERLEERLRATHGAPRRVFVVTESLFSMDGDYPELARMAELKRRYRFCWVVDEAHALGWYGPAGAGLVRATGAEAEVDVLVGTFGKALASGGAYSLFRDASVRDHLVNAAGEFVYSTSLPPTTVAAAAAAVGRAASLADAQGSWHAASRRFRACLREAGWRVPDGDSPIVPVALGSPDASVALADALRQEDILVGAIRPPTVPAGTSRLRISLKRTTTTADCDRVLKVMGEWRAAR